MTAKPEVEAADAQIPAAGRACRVHAFGGPETIRVETVEIPRPANGEILVRVAAAGVGPWDAWIRAGKSALPQPLPLTLGSDFAGVVAAVGSDSPSLAPGDAVFGVTNAQFTGSYADYAIASAAMVARKPESLSYIEAASVPVIAVTAWQALFEQGRLLRGQTVLIHGAAGSVGAFAVQLAHQAGLHVIATCSAADEAYVRHLGADQTVAREGPPFESLVRAVDGVIDLVGGEVQARSFATLKAGGVLVSAVAPPDQAVAARHEVRAMFFLVNVTTDYLCRIARMLAAGDLETSVGTVLPLASARLAHEMLDGARPRLRGKIVLRVSD